MVFDKQKYWENRKEGKRGQGEIKPASSPLMISGDAEIGFGDDGKMVLRNRAFRRQKIRLAPKTSQLRKKGKRKKK